MSTIQVDEHKAQRKITIRERCAVKVLFLIFSIIYPAKYNHELKEFIEALFADVS